MKIVINEPDGDQYEKERVKRIFQVGNVIVDDNNDAFLISSFYEKGGHPKYIMIDLSEGIACGGAFDSLDELINTFSDEDDRLLFRPELTGTPVSDTDIKS
ncbi:MAG: hypothetical protein L0I00_08110 [Lactiplantibacillus plantarum]|nr:hypothetical protein [Lactiplantibacillus plantarum]MDN5951378.1 hypothetical protein [Loigolactobacillus coryniformis]